MKAWCEPKQEAAESLVTVEGAIVGTDPEGWLGTLARWSYVLHEGGGEGGGAEDRQERRDGSVSPLKEGGDGRSPREHGSSRAVAVVRES